MCRKKTRKETSKFLELKNVEYWNAIKARTQDRDDYVHVMQLDDSNSQASFSYVHLPPHNQRFLFLFSI